MKKKKKKKISNGRVEIQLRTEMPAVDIDPLTGGKRHTLRDNSSVFLENFGKQTHKSANCSQVKCGGQTEGLKMEPIVELWESSGKLLESIDEHQTKKQRASDLSPTVAS